MMTDNDILIVDDQPFVCKTLARELIEGGFRAESVTSGKEAIRKAKEKNYDLFFVDISMPEMDGIETCRALKKLKPDAEYVCFTGMFNRILSTRGRDTLDIDGEVKLLYKPFRMNTFLELAEKVLCAN